MSSIMKGIVDEEVGGNYLYHATSAGGLKSILQSGQVNAATGPQLATRAQTKMPTVSVTRDWGYASGVNATQQMGGIGRDAILVFDRSRIENNFKTLGTSQTSDVRGLAYNPNFGGKEQNQSVQARTIAKKKYDYAQQSDSETKASYNSPKAGGEFEEAVVVPKGGLPIKNTLIGFWVNPESNLTKDPEIMNHPLRLEKTGPNKFVKAKQEVTESEEVAVIYIDGKPSAKYAKKHEAERDAEFMRSRHPNKKIEIKHEVREAEAKKGIDGKRCWKGKRYAGTENGKDKCIPVKEGDVVPFKKKTDKDKYNTAIAKQRGPLPISRIDPDSAITVKSRRPGDPIEIPDEYQDINLKSKVRGVPKQNQTNFEVWGNNHGYYVFGNNTNAVLSAWPNGEMMVLSDPSDSKGRENCQRFAKQVMKPIELDSLRPKLKNKIVQKMSMIDQPMNEGVIVGHDANDPEVAILGGAGTMSLSRLKKKAQGEAEQLANDLARGRFKAAAYNIKQLQNTLNTIVAAEDEMSKKYFGETDEHDYSDYEERNMLDDLYDMDLPKPGDSVTIDGRHGIVKAEVNQDTYGGPAEFEVKYDDGTVRLHSVDAILTGDSSYDEDFIDEDYTGEFAAEKTPEVNPYGGQRNRKFRGAIGEALLSEMPDTSGPVGVQPGGWRRTDIDEYREMSPALKAAQQNLIALRNKEKATNVSGKRERAPRDKVELDKPKPASVLTKGAQEVDPDTMDAIKAFLAKGGEIKKGRPGKAPPTGRQQASKHIGGGGKYRRKSDTPGQGANYRGAAIVAVEDTAYAGGMGQGGNAGESYRKFKPKSAGTFNESACRDCKHGYPADICPECEDEYKEKQEKAKKKSTVKKESSIMKGLKR